eukprot:1178176-Pyramimonas_sp.AAC.1
MGGAAERGGASSVSQRRSPRHRSVRSPRAVAAASPPVRRIPRCLDRRFRQGAVGGSSAVPYMGLGPDRAPQRRARNN